MGNENSNILIIPSEDLDQLIEATQVAINAVNQRNGFGDKPRVVGAELAFHPLFEKYYQHLVSENMAWVTVRRFTQLWDENADQEGVTYQCEIYGEFTCGLRAFEEAISY